MTTFEMYLFTRVDKLLCVFGVLSFFSCIALGLAIVFFVMARADWDLYSDRERRMTKVALLFTMPIVALSSLCFVAIPTQKELAAIIVVPKILSSENVDNLTKIGANGIDIVKLATEYTKGILEEKVNK